jgi:hypothetical protein
VASLLEEGGRRAMGDGWDSERNYIGGGGWATGDEWYSERNAGEVLNIQAPAPHQCFIPNSPSPIVHRPSAVARNPRPAKSSG